jgi:ABC-type nickel/cobalt efflux system permease component RcnA
MAEGSGLLLVGAVAAVGVLHTIVPDHWVPITLIARQRGWSKAETARVALKAGTGHILSTLAIALIIWIGGVAVATRFGHWVDTIASVALIGFGAWIAISAWRDLRRGGGHGHSHDLDHGHSHDLLHLQAASSVHGPELQKITTEHGEVELSIFEAGVPPRFRLTGAFGDSAVLETRRDDGSRQTFTFKNRGDYWESTEEIPEPHQFAVTLTMDHEGHAHTYSTQLTEHQHSHEGHGHDHPHPEKTKDRTALLLILGSSPMVEGIPAFFAASKYGVGLIILMSVVFAATTIATYILLCVYSTAGLQRVSLGPVERYGEVLSGGFIALVGLAFWLWPVL